MVGSSLDCVLPKHRARGRNGRVSATIVGLCLNNGEPQNYLEMHELFGNGISKYFSITPK
jgi:hypothetical protein